MRKSHKQKVASRKWAQALRRAEKRLAREMSDEVDREIVTMFCGTFEKPKAQAIDGFDHAVPGSDHTAYALFAEPNDGAVRRIMDLEILRVRHPRPVLLVPDVPEIDLVQLVAGPSVPRTIKASFTVTDLRRKRRRPSMEPR